MYSYKQRMSKILPHTGSCVPEMQRGWNHYWWRFIRSGFSICTRTYTLCTCSSSDYSEKALKWHLCCGKVINASVWRMMWCRMAVSEARTEAGEGVLIWVSGAAIWCLSTSPCLLCPTPFKSCTRQVGPSHTLKSLFTLLPQHIVPSTEDGKDTVGTCRDQELKIFLSFVYICIFIYNICVCVGTGMGF